MKRALWTVKAFVSGRIGLVRSLGREGVPVAVAVPAHEPYAAVGYSRYSREVVPVPNFAKSTEKALLRLEQWASAQAEKPIVFCNGESDVLLFSRNRDRLSKYFHIPLAPADLLEALVDKGKFAALSDSYGLQTPRTVIPKSNEECLQAAREIGFPCILKPVNQRYWHEEIIQAALGGTRKAVLLNSEEDLKRLLGRFPEITGREMVQEYVPGPDIQHYDFHSYIDHAGTVKGWVVGHKLRTYPIHFGQGAYTHYVDEPRIAQVCLTALERIGYTGKANINLKRHSVTGKDYILEINPRFSIWSVFDQRCGVNLAMQQYKDALGLPTEFLTPHGRPQRWLWLSHDLMALRDYRRAGELTYWRWFKSLFTERGPVEFQMFAWDDPLAAPLSVYSTVRRKAHYWGLAVRRRLHLPTPQTEYS